MDGHNFGFRSAVLNFNACPHLVCAFNRVLLAVPADHFFDDFLIPDLQCAGASGQDGLSLCLALLGQSHEPSKRAAVGPSHVGLGVRIDVSRVHTDLVVSAAPTPERLSSILYFLRSCLAHDDLSPSMASTCRGKLGFVFASSYYHFGRAALQPLLQREYFDSPPFTFSSPLRCMLQFLSYVLPILPPLDMRLRPETSPPIVVYTDAMFVPRAGLHELRIGWFIYCPLRRRSFHSHYTLPLTFFTQFFAQGQRTYISQGEAVGACAPFLSCPSLFRGRHIVQFQGPNFRTIPVRSPPSSMAMRPSQTWRASSTRSTCLSFS